MKTRYDGLLCAVLGLMACAAPAGAAGINLAWDDCGTHGVLNKSFACTTNSGPRFTLFASFAPPADVDRFLGLSGQIDVTSWSATFPNWWKHGDGQCRGGTSLTTSMDFIEGPFNCTDVFVARAPTVFLYEVGFGGPHRARLHVAGALRLEDAEPLDPSVEYYAFKVLIDRTRSTGPGSCAGCCTRMDLVLNEIQLFQPIDANNDPIISNSLNWQMASWQASTPSCEVTPVRAGTWGQLKGLWR